MIRLTEVSKQYQRGADTVRALDRVSLHIDPQKFVALMGPSGSGKSTLLNVVAGLDQPTSGEITVAGTSLSGLSEDALASFRSDHVGIVFQFFNLIPVLNARENVELPLLLKKFSRAERRKRADTALRVVSLSDRGEHAPGELSGGEQQRVAIARAIVGDPDLIIADEPTGDLDAVNAESILSLLAELSKNFGKTVLMVTHDDRALRHVDMTYRLDKGVLADSPAAERAI